MATTNHERVGKGLELLKAGLGPFVEREFKNTYKDRAAIEASRFMGDTRLTTQRGIADWDAAGLLTLMWESWNDIFRRTLGPAQRSLVSELRDQRNKWAHQQSFRVTMPTALSILQGGFSPPSRPRRPTRSRR
jgi:hypothetical protein